MPDFARKTLCDACVDTSTGACRLGEEEEEEEEEVWVGRKKVGTGTYTPGGGGSWDGPMWEFIVMRGLRCADMFTCRKA